MRILLTNLSKLLKFNLWWIVWLLVILAPFNLKEDPLRLIGEWGLLSLQSIWPDRLIANWPIISKIFCSSKIIWIICELAISKEKLFQKDCSASASFYWLSVVISLQKTCSKYSCLELTPRATLWFLRPNLPS